MIGGHQAEWAGRDGIAEPIRMPRNPEKKNEAKEGKKWSGRFFNRLVGSWRDGVGSVERHFIQVKRVFIVVCILFETTLGARLCSMQCCRLTY